MLHKANTQAEGHAKSLLEPTSYSVGGTVNAGTRLGNEALRKRGKGLKWTGPRYRKSPTPSEGWEEFEMEFEFFSFASQG
jgi:hypothetical protein